MPLARSQPLTTNQQIAAIFARPALYELGAAVPADQPSGGPAHHPGYLLLGYGVLARLYRSGTRVQTELADPGTWQSILDTVAEMRPRAPTWSTGSRAPSRRAGTPTGTPATATSATPTSCPSCRQLFTQAAVAQAREHGAARPHRLGPCRQPDRSRIVYGDGTVVRPLYRPPTAKRVTDPTTGKARVVYLTATGTRCRPRPAGSTPTPRTTTATPDRCTGRTSSPSTPAVTTPTSGSCSPSPGSTAPGLRGRHRRGGDQAAARRRRPGIQAIVYDGAMRGVHIDDLMTTTACWSSTRSTPPPRPPPAREAAQPALVPPGHLGARHQGGACTHQLAAVDGAVSEIGLDEAGKPVVLAG